MKTLMTAVAPVLAFSTTIFAQPETAFLADLRINTCQNDVCVNLDASLHPTESRLAYLVYDRLTGLPIIPPVDIYEDLPAGGLVINKQGTEATLVTEGIALTWQATGAVSVASSGVNVYREFGRIVRRNSLDGTYEQMRIWGTLRGVAVDHIGEMRTETQRTITR